jgi:hypothetical protein
MTLTCITNDIADLRSCTITGRHMNSCDGFEYRTSIDTSRSPADPLRKWSRTPALASTWDAEVSAFRMLPKPCKGCMPRQAEHGLLCWDCWEKTTEALRIATDMVTHLRSVERAQQQDNAGIRTSQDGRIPLPTSWLMADEMIMLLGCPAPGFPSTADVEEVDAITRYWVDGIDLASWVSSVHGAEDAVRFYLAIQHAMAQHPMKEYEHQVKTVRCYKCRQLTLWWMPPLMFEDAVQVVCKNKKCGAIVDQAMYEWLAVLEEPGSKRKPKPDAAEATA